MQTTQDQLTANAGFLEKKFIKIANNKFKNSDFAFEINFYKKNSYKIGQGSKAFTIIINNKKGLRACIALEQLAICEAYIFGDLDFSGDMMKLLDLRVNFSSSILANLLRMFKHISLGQKKGDKKAIAEHYEYPDGFYLAFMDETRTYSHGFYENDNDSLQKAMLRKLNYALDSCKVKKGMRILDIGGGWGAMAEHAGKKGIEVTSLTIAEKSRDFVARLIKKHNFSGRVLLENFLEHKAKEPYDAIINLGVIEHLPKYKLVVKQYQKLLKKGGRVYMDGSAAEYKFLFSPFLNKYIYPGNHCAWSVHDFLAEVQNSNLEIIELISDRHNYYLTAKAWAENLELKKQEIIAKWGQTLYRKFHLYLWGVAHCFFHNSLQAYHSVLELNPAS